MKEFVISEAKTETAVLVGLITGQQDEAKTKEYLDELEFLAETAGAKVIKRFTQRVGGPSSVTYVGSGKLMEIKDYIKQQEDAYDEWLENGGDNADLSPLTPHSSPLPVGMVILRTVVSSVAKSLFSANTSLLARRFIMVDLPTFV